MNMLFIVSFIVLGNILYSLFIAMLPVFVALKVHPSTKEITRLTSANFASYQSNPLLIHIVKYLSKKANLKSCPKTYLIGSNNINAFTSGEGDDTIVCVTNGVINQLEPNELEAVLAHEIAHLKENDMFYLKLVQIIYFFTTFISTIINFTIILALPLLFMGIIKLNILPIILILIAPNLIRLIIMAYMRNREFAADENAISMTNDPKSLARALQKLTGPRFSLIDLFFPRKKTFSIANIFETHPTPEQRIKKLNDLDF
jgi:heat shock protein HtpX